MGCFDRSLIQRVTAIRLDACGRIPTVEENPTPALKGIERVLKILEDNHQVTEATQETDRLVTGATCQKPRGTPTDNGLTVTLTFCGQQPLFEALTGYKRAVIGTDTDGGDIIGFDELPVQTATQIALEVVFAPVADACQAGETPPCDYVLIPLLESWTKTAGLQYNGSAVPDLVMAGTGRTNPGLFGNYSSAGELPAYLSHWADRFEDIVDGDALSYGLFTECPDPEPEDPCVFSALDDVS